MPKTLDARGRSCPEPVIMTKDMLESNPNEPIEIIVDTHVAVENITRFATGKGYNVDVEEKGEEYILNIRK